MPCPISFIYSDSKAKKKDRVREINRCSNLNKIKCKKILENESSFFSIFI